MRMMFVLWAPKPALPEHTLSIEKLMLPVEIFVIASVQSLDFVRNNIHCIYHEDHLVYFGCTEFLQNCAD
jgi:hypothetical protein